MKDGLEPEERSLLTSARIDKPACSKLRPCIVIVSGGARGIAARGQIYMGAPIGVVEIHL